MRPCVEKDFLSNGFTPDDAIIHKLKQNKYLCFDISGKGEFIVSNFYNDGLRKNF